MSDENGREDIDSRFLAAARGLLVLLVPLGGILGAYITTRAALSARIDSNERDIKVLHAAIAEIKEDLDEIDSELSAHRNMGPDGLPHPQGVIRDVAQLRERVTKLESKE